MKGSEIKVGGLYMAKVNAKLVTVRVDKVESLPNGKGGTETCYNVTNLSTGRRTKFYSAAKFRSEAISLEDTARAALDKRIQEAIESSEPEMSSDEAIDAVVAKHDVEGEQRPDPTLILGSGQSAGVANVVISEDRQTTSLALSAATVVVGLMPSISHLISESRAGRQRGSPVAGMMPNDEQEDILSIAAELDELQKCGRVLVVAAGAGCGKTAQLKMLECTLTGTVQYTAFNRSLVDEARPKFKKAKCSTTHQLAFHAVGKRYAHRLPSDDRPRMRNDQVAKVLGISPFTVELSGEVDKEGKPRTKTLSSDYLAGKLLMFISRFCMGAEREITTKHIGYTDGIDGVTELVGEDGEPYRKRDTVNNDKVKAYLLPFCQKAWKDLTDINGQLPFGHDIYVKIWQLGTGDDRPIIAADNILLDEAQDTAPVFLDIIKQQTHALLVMVGDDNQQIYEWRGAVNAMTAFPGAPRRMLSQSYRFGQMVADVANAVLVTLEEPTDLVMRGNPTIASQVCVVDEPRCYLYRTNAGAIGRLMNAIEEGKRPHLIGKPDETIKWCTAALDLQQKRPTRHYDLCCFDSWEEVQEYSKTDEGGDLRLMVKIVDSFGAAEIIKALKGMPKEKDADLVISTAHKSKGREWNSVKLGVDFPTKNKMSDADRRLLYVAATRAKLQLDISECPPFCGGNDYGDGADGESRFIPGIEIVYTTPAPTVEQMKNEPVLKQLHEAIKEATTTNNGVTRQLATIFTWTKFGNAWAARGPKDTPLNTEVTIERRDGSTSQLTLKRVMFQYDDAWIYEV